MASAWGTSWASAWNNSWGSVATATTPTTDTHDGGWSREEYGALRKRIREGEKAREQSEQAKKRAKQKLVDELERAYRKVVLNEPEIAAEVLKAAIAAEPQSITEADQIPQIDFRKFKDILDTAGQILAILERERAVAAWFAEDEADVEILLLC